MKKGLSQKQRREIVEKHLGKIPWGRFTPGIYNYCDRWCERCNKQDKCLLRYEELKENEQLVRKGKNPKDMKIVLDRVGKSLSQTKDLIADIAEAEGIDLTMPQEDENEYGRMERKTNPQRYKIVKFAAEIFKETYQITELLPPTESEEIEEELRQIAHYAPLVAVKTNSAMYSKLHAKLANEKHDKDNKKFWENDSFKTACIAYRGAKICRDSLKAVNSAITDYRLQSLIDDYQKLIKQIDSTFLTQKL